MLGMRRMIMIVAVIIEADTKKISSFFLQKISRYSIAPSGLKLSITTSSNTKHLGYKLVSDLLADRETKGSRHWLESRLTRDSFSLMPVATANRREPNKSRSSGSISVNMNVPFLLLMSGASRDDVCDPMSGTAVGRSAGSADAPGTRDWQIADTGWPTKIKMRSTNLMQNLVNTCDMGELTST